MKDIIKEANIIPDFLVLDEAHRLTGKQSKIWKDCLDNNIITVKKRLLITASPVFYSGSDQYIGFENVALTGKIVHRYTLSQGISDGFIAPVEVLGFKLEETKLDLIKNAYQSRRQIIQENLFDMYGVDLDHIEEDLNKSAGDLVFFLQIYNCITALKSGLITHPIIYCNSITRSQLFIECLVQIAKSEFDLEIPYAKCLDSNQSLKARDKMLKRRYRCFCYRFNILC